MMKRVLLCSLAVTSLLASSVWACKDYPGEDAYFEQEAQKVKVPQKSVVKNGSKEDVSESSNASQEGKPEAQKSFVSQFPYGI